jgi:hypothetical protein
MIYTLKKVFYRIARYIYVLKKSPLKKWATLLFLKNNKILFETVVLQYDRNEQKYFLIKNKTDEICRRHYFNL